MASDIGIENRCVFCAIVESAAEASVVHQDEHAVAFMDLNPMTPGHLLVVPRRHAAGLEDLDEETSTHVWRLAHRLARALRRSGLRCEGINVFMADGEVAFQEVFHFHLHVIARHAGDGFTINAEGKQGHGAFSTPTREPSGARSSTRDTPSPAATESDGDTMSRYINHPAGGTPVGRCLFRECSTPPTGRCRSSRATSSTSCPAPPALLSTRPQRAQRVR